MKTRDISIIALVVAFVLIVLVGCRVVEDLGSGDFKLVQCGTMTECEIRYYFKTQESCEAMKKELDTEVHDEKDGYTIRYVCEKK